jgi:serine/threonine protein kinase
MPKYGRWETRTELGRGGQGVVYVAKDSTVGMSKEKLLERVSTGIRKLNAMTTPETHLTVFQSFAEAITELIQDSVNPSSLGALKVLHTPAEKTKEYEKARERMTNEVSALGKITHPNVLKLLDSEIQEGWFVGEYHPQGPLSKHPSLFHGDIVSALAAFRTLVDAVVVLHEAKLVHRDIKPDNVFVATDGRLVLGDMGLVFFTDKVHSRVSEKYENVGSRDWMPAWAMGMRIEDIEPNFDIFCLGKLLWAMLSGRTFLRLWYHHEEDFELEKVFPRDESIRWARTILDKCIVEKKKDCLQTAGELLTLVDEVLPAVRRYAQVVGDGIPRRCQVCGLGTYDCIADEDPTALGNFGLDPRGSTSKVFACSHCGHVQIFHILHPQSRPKAWTNS